MKHRALHFQEPMTEVSRSPATLMNSAEDLVGRVRAGDEQAFRLIFERYARPMLSFIYDQTGERGLAEELTQETFVRAYRSIGTLRSDDKLSTWLFGIAKNVSREAIRSRKRRGQEFEIESPQVAALDDGRLQPDGQLLQKELNSRLHVALQSLDEDKRLVFSLKVLQERSYEDIAEITGFSIAKVKTDLHRARLEVRCSMRSYLEVGR